MAQVVDNLETEAVPQLAEAPGDIASDKEIATSPNAESRRAENAPVPPQATKVIKFSHVSKRFTLHHERSRSFQDMVVSLFGLRSLSKRGVALPRPTSEDFWALRDVNFSIYAGEAVGIIGANGSGKSTTLKLISRILDPTSGSVSVKGKVSALLELGTGFHPELTGKENIFLNGSLLGVSRKDMAARYESIVDFAELGEFIDTPIKHYSSGMVMRLGFAVAVSVDPDILLTDEVLAVGDEAFQRKCMERISSLRRRGVTILFVSHALEAVRSLCRRVIWIDHGRLIADGPAGEVIDRYLAYENERHAERLRAEHGYMPAEQTVEPPKPMDHVDDATDVETSGEPESPHDQQTNAETSAEEATVEVESEQEAPRTVSSGAIPETPGSRWTTGDIQITDVRFVDGEGRETPLFKTGDSFTIRLFYEASKRLEKPTFGLALYSENGTQINGPNTKFAGLEVPFIEGSGYVDYRVERLPLLAGQYDVTVAITGPEMTDVYDHQHMSYNFTVLPTPGLPERRGLVYIPAEWSFHPDSPQT